MALGSFLLLWSYQQGREHRLKPMNERVGFLVALKERSNLRIFDDHLLAQECIFVLQARDVALI